MQICKILKEPDLSHAVYLCQKDNNFWIKKIYYHQTSRQKLQKYLHNSRAHRQYYHWNLLKKAGIPTYESMDIHFSKQSSVLDMPFLDYPTALEFFNRDLKTNPRIPKACMQLWTLWIQLLENGFYYRDINFSNFLMSETLVYLIDLDHLQKFPKFLFPYFYRKTKKRVFENWEERDYIPKYLKEYFVCLFTTYEIDKKLFDGVISHGRP